MSVILHLASSRKVMGKFTIPKYLMVGGWAATVAMLGASVGLVLTWGSN
jgi:Mn2+/Fe2+ NRAMP family transporter